jgi:hypothetical protein
MRLLARLALLGYFGAFILVTATLAYTHGRYRQPPAQPIAFAHSIHAGRLGLDCLFCHEFANRSPRAGVPTVEKCLSCHRSIATDREQIKILQGYSERGEPIAWNRVHQLPEHVYFTHKRHIKAGLDCAACHGGVREMTLMRQVRPLTMGWCVTCHRANGASIDCATCHQ